MGASRVLALGLRVPGPRLLLVSGEVRRRQSLWPLFFFCGLAPVKSRFNGSLVAPPVSCLPVGQAFAVAPASRPLVMVGLRHRRVHGARGKR